MADTRTSAKMRLLRAIIIRVPFRSAAGTMCTREREILVNINRWIFQLYFNKYANGERKLNLIMPLNPARINLMRSFLQAIWLTITV